MSHIQAWFERKFELTFPVTLYPNLGVRLRGTPARLDEMLRDIAGEILVAKPDGKWSAQEHAGHLLDLELLWTTRVDDFLSDRDTLTVADLSNRKTDEANHNGRSLAHLLLGFREARSLLVNRIEPLDAALFTRSLLHPRLKQPMRLIDHLYFVAEHDDHHLARIWELIGPEVNR
jgi:hypothetical protein